MVSFAGATLSNSVAELLWAGLPESTTLNVSEAEALAVGVPLITPALNDSPAGNVPLVSDHV